MARTEWIERLENAAIARNPILATNLRPGLSEARVQSVLSRARVEGDVAAVIALYTWKDGMDLNFEAPQGVVPNFYESEKLKRSFLPGKPYLFIPLETAVGHFSTFQAVAKNYPKISEAVGRYFPVFWDGSTERLVVDIKPLNHNRILIVDHRSVQPIREAYGAFDEFIADAIEANTEDRLLHCFEE